MIPPTPIIHLYPIENFAPLTPLCNFSYAEALGRGEVVLLALPLFRVSCVRFLELLQALILLGI